MPWPHPGRLIQPREHVFRRQNSNNLMSTGARLGGPAPDYAERAALAGRAWGNTRDLDPAYVPDAIATLAIESCTAGGRVSSFLALRTTGRGLCQVLTDRLTARLTETIYE